MKMKLDTDEEKNVFISFPRNPDKLFSLYMTPA